LCGFGGFADIIGFMACEAQLASWGAYITTSQLHEKVGVHSCGEVHETNIAAPPFSPAFSFEISI